MASRQLLSDSRPLDRSRARGALLGMALGEAVGAPYQPSFEAVLIDAETALAGGGILELAPGSWSIQTATMLATAESLIDLGRFDAADVKTRVLQAWTDLTSDARGRAYFEMMEPTSFRSLFVFAEFGDLYDPWYGQDPSVVDGSGSCCRAVAGALFHSGHTAYSAAVANDFSGLTHGAEESKALARLVTWLVCEAVKGRGKEEILRELALSTALRSELNTLRFGHPRLYGGKLVVSRPSHPSAGHPATTLNAVLHALAVTGSFEDGLLEVVGLGGNCGSVGAIYGAVAGAFYGAEGIRSDWLRQLHRREYIEHVADRLLARADAKREASNFALEAKRTRLLGRSW